MLERLDPYVIPKRQTTLRKSAEKVLAHFGMGTRPSYQNLVTFLQNDKELLRWLERAKTYPLRPAQPEAFPQVMCPATGPPSKWEVLPLPTEGDIASWLGLTYGELLWFTDHFHNRDPNHPAHHYTYEWRRKRSGGRRLLEKPKEALKLYQRRILRDVFAPIPPHEAVHSFLAGRSVVSYVAGHVGKAVVLRMDIADFFPSLSRARVRALLRTAGYPDTAATTLSNLVCHATPASIVNGAERNISFASRERLLHAHLPQGAPTSSALSNLLLYRLDTRLSGLAQAVGAHYTRYADDLAFSGDASVNRIGEGLIPQITAIASSEGLTINHRKTRVMRANQRQFLGGQVTNQRPNVRREDYERLKAILFNAANRGPASQFPASSWENPKRQLQGKIAWVAMVNPERGARLQRLYDQITWPDSKE